MKIALTNGDCRVLSASKRSENALSEALAFTQPNYYWTKAYQQHHWDGRRKFYNKVTKLFPSGLLPYALEVLTENDVHSKIIDRRALHAPSVVLPPERWATLLRSRGFDIHPVQCVLQHLAIRAVARQTVGRNQLPWPRGLISMPTGSGKTVTAFWACQMFGGHSLYLVPRRDLLLQGADVYRLLTGQEIGQIGMGRWDPKQITMAMIQTLGPRVRQEDSRVLSFLHRIRTVVVDEAHLVSDNVYQDIVRACPRAFVRLAFGGSLLRRTEDLGDWFLTGTFGDVLYHLPSRKLRACGLLSKVSVFMFKVTQPRTQARYAAAERLAIHHNEYRNKLGIAAALHAAESGWITLLLVQKRAHGEVLRRMFRSYGMRVPFLCYRDPAERRKHYLDAMRREETRIVIASGIFHMGIDVPVIRCIVRLDGGKSQIASLQIPGRGMRKKKVINELYLIDFDDQMSPYFARHSRDRLKVYREEGYVIRSVEDVEDIPFTNLNQYTAKNAARSLS